MPVTPASTLREGPGLLPSFNFLEEKKDFSVKISFAIGETSLWLFLL